MYKTADTLEDLNIVEELCSYDTVCGVEEHNQIFDEEYKDADFRIFVRDFTELEQIKRILCTCGYTAYIDNDEMLIKI